MIKIYEVVDFSHGNTDFLSDLEDTSDIRTNMIAYYPQTVESKDKQKKAIKFIENRTKYPKTKTKSFDNLVEKYNTIVGNYSNIMLEIEDKKNFISKLFLLKEYISKFENKRPLNEENEDGEDKNVENTNVVKFSLDGRKDYATQLATKLTKKLNLNSNFSYLGGGANGFAFEISSDVVLKITVDSGEVETAKLLLNKTPKYLAIPYNIYKVFDSETKEAFYVILLENVDYKPKRWFLMVKSLYDIISPGDLSYADLFFSNFKTRNSFDYDGTIEIISGVLTDKMDVGINMRSREKIYQFMVGLANIKRELVEYGSKSLDFTVLDNLGYKNGVLKFFDYGGYTGKNLVIDKREQIVVENLLITEDDDYSDVFDKISSIVQEKLKIDKLEKLSDGTMGSAYDIVGKNLVMKITKDQSEAYANKQLINKKPKYLAKPYKVISVNVKNTRTTYYVIILEKVKTNTAEFNRLMNRLRFVFTNVFGVGLVDTFEYLIYGNKLDKELDKEKLLKYMLKNKEDGWFFQSLLRIGRELVEHDISSIDFLNPRNLGFRDPQTIVFFDIGMSDYVGSNQTIIEDSSALFSTDDSYGRDDIINKNKSIIPPDNDNNIERNCVAERKMGWVDGSETVEVKKKCKLGGLGNTSAQCNQGDINNLTFKKVK